MRLLVLGGGGFLGRHVVATALAGGHDVTVFSRDDGAPVAGAEVLVGDRHGDLDALRGREWDAVFDTFSDPDAVRATAELLAGAVGAYGFVSGMSVYHPSGPAVPDEASPVRAPGDPTGPDPLQERSLDKLAGEEAVAAAFDGPSTVFRVGVMVGPHDPTDRFTWWPVRLARALAGDAPPEVLAPGDPGRPVQYSDARDIAAFAVSALDRGLPGTFDTVGPLRAEPLSAVLAACLRAAVGEQDGSPAGRHADGAAVSFAWAGEDALRAALEREGLDDEERRPLWFPEDQIPTAAIDSSAAQAAGLHFRPAEDTARDTLAWARSQGHDLAAGFDPAVEHRLLRGATTDRHGGPNV